MALQESRDWRWKDHIFADDTCAIFSQITVDGKASLKPSYGRGQITKIINTKRKVNTVKKKKKVKIKINTETDYHRQVHIVLPKFDQEII